MEFSDRAYLDEDGSLTLPNEDYFALVKVLVDGLENISNGVKGPSIFIEIDQEKGVATLIVGSEKAGFARKYRCLVGEDGNYVYMS